MPNLIQRPKHAEVEKLQKVLIKNDHLLVNSYSPHYKSEIGCENYSLISFLTKAKPFCIGEAVTYCPWYNEIKILIGYH